MTDKLKQSDFLGPPITAEYMPQYMGNAFYSNTKFPPFTTRSIMEMLYDARVVFGLGLIKGPLTCYGKFFIKCDDAILKQFIIDNLTRFWRNSVYRALKCIEWGYSCSEVTYRIHEGLIYFDNLRDIHAMDAKCLSHRGKVVGATIKGVQGSKTKKTIIAGPRCLWMVHGHDYNPYYGRSRLRGAYYPWFEKWTEGGFRDCRRLWFHKNAYDGGTMYYPPGSTPDTVVQAGGKYNKSNKDLAREIVEKKKTGGVLALPSIVTESGTIRQWEYVPPGVPPAPEGLLEYGDSLSDEILEGMEVPPEIASAQGTGAYAGRKVPQQSFFCGLQNILQGTVTQFDECSLNPMILMNFGYEASKAYEIIPYNLLEELAKIEAASEAPQPMLGEGDDPSLMDDPNAEPGLDPNSDPTTDDESGSSNGKPKKKASFNRLNHVNGKA